MEITSKVLLDMSLLILENQKRMEKFHSTLIALLSQALTLKQEKKKSFDLFCTFD